MFINIISIFCFILLFIYGINVLTSFLESYFLNKSKLHYSKLSNIYVSFIFGTLITFLTQSSSAITAIMIAFLNAKQIKLKNAIAVMLGANIGTTFTSLITSFSLDQYSYIILGVGLFLSLLKKTNNISKFFIGLGFIFYSLFCLKNTLAVVFDNIEYIYFLKYANNSVILSTWNGILLSGLLQSSSVTIAITQLCATNGSISVLSGICVILGSNIGTTFTGLICSLKSSYESKLLAISHLIINVLGVFVILPFVKYFIRIKYNNISLFLSLIHIFFNIISCSASLFFINQIIKLSKLLVKKEPNLKN